MTSPTSERTSMATRTNEAPKKQVDFGDLHEAILDLTRVTLAVSGKFPSKNEAMRKLAELSIPPSRIATLLAVPPNNVTSTLSKAKKSGKAERSDDKSSSDGAADA